MHSAAIIFLPVGRHHGRVTVIGGLVRDPSSIHAGRYHVRYHEDDTTYHCRPEGLRKVLPVRWCCAG